MAFMQCAQSPGGSVDFGYVPQTLVDFLVANPAYSSQYPGLASCLPGGPAVSSVKTYTEPGPGSESKFPAQHFLNFANAVAAAGGDLTSSTLITVTPSGIKATSISPPPQSTLPVPQAESMTPTAPQSPPPTSIATPSQPSQTTTQPTLAPSQESQPPVLLQSQTTMQPIPASQPST